MLEISDIDPEPRPIKYQIREINGIPTVYYDCFTNGIGYAILSFDCKNIPTELLPYIGLLKNTAGYMNTESYNYTQLANEIKILVEYMLMQHYIRMQLKRISSNIELKLILSR